MHHRVLEEIYELALTVLIKYLVESGSNFLLVFAHESLGFWNEPRLASDAVRVDDHEHRKWSLRLIGKFIGHAYRVAEKMSLSTDWLPADLL